MHVNSINQYLKIEEKKKGLKKHNEINGIRSRDYLNTKHIVTITILAHDFK